MNDCLICDSRLAMQISDKIEAIAKCLETSIQIEPNLMNGKTGEMIFWSYYSQFHKHTLPNKEITSILSDIFDQVKNGYQFTTFCTGLAGIGWAVEHLVQNDFLKANTNKIIGSLDDFLNPFMLHYMQEGNYDYLHGALGIGLYHLNRTSNQKAEKYLSELVNEMEKQCTRMSHGIAWERKLMPKSDKRGYNLSLSHGIASIIVILSRLYERGICKEKTTELVTGSVNYLLQNKLDATSNYQFPCWIYKEKDETTQGGRLSWCYYDLGIAIALWQAGYIFDKKEWKKEAIDTLLNTTRITDINESGVSDAGLCHGTIGIAHIYHRMYTYTNIVAFKNSAIYWFDQSLNMATFEDGLAGYKSFRTPEYGGSKNDYSLLTGITGIGLAMISAVSNIEPRWDSALLLS